MSENTAALRTNRSLAKFLFLGFITLGIYDLVMMTNLTNEVNLICSRYDGKKTMHYCLLTFLITPITLGIAPLVWYHRISDRIGAELARRAIPYTFNAGTFWLWNILGALIIVGPFVYIAKLCRAMNLLNAEYNKTAA